MKKLLLITMLFTACTKSPNGTSTSNPVKEPTTPTTGNKVSAAHGCVTCTTSTYVVFKISTGDTQLICKPFDSTLCNIPDTSLAAYISWYSYNGTPNCMNGGIYNPAFIQPTKSVIPMFVGTDPRNIELVITVCK